MTDHFTVLANVAGSDNSMQGCRGDGISIPIPIIIPTEKHVGIPTEYPQNNWQGRWRAENNKESNVTCTTSLAVNKESIRLGHWLLCVLFSALTAMVGWQERQDPLKSLSTTLQRFSSRKSGRREQKR